MVDNIRTTKSKLLLFVGAIMVAAVLIGVFMLGATYPGEQETKREANDFTLVDVRGNVFSLTDYRGHIVVIDFMATWCGPCREEVRHLAKISASYGDRVVLLSISVSPESDTDEKLLDFAKRFGVKWTLARDTAKVAIAYDVSAIPTLVVVDQNGFVGYRHVGLTSESTLSAAIDGLLSRS